MKQLTSVILIMLFTLVLSAQAKVEDIKTFTLKNGMKFIVLEDHKIPNASSYIFFKVGSRNEFPGITGISHFIEHMMFNGAKKYGPKQFDITMEAEGGSNNAYTNENVTVYTDFFPSSILELIFDLESDRMASLTIDDKMLESERGVIHSEYTTSRENSPVSLLMEETQAVVFQAHPYHWSVIGYESDILNWRKSDLQKYIETYYAPNNAVAVFVGDVTLEKIKSLAEKYFEFIPSRTPPRPVTTKEPEQLGEKRLTVYRDVSSPHVLIGYHAPESNTKDAVVLDLLSDILTSGKTSRLYKSLVSDKQIGVETFSYMPTAIDPTWIFFYVVSSQTGDETTIEKAMLQEIDKIISDGVTDEELQKVKNAKIVSFYEGLETNSGKANKIGTYEVYYGSYKKMFETVDEYKKVTKDDIKAAAAKYFKKSNRTVGVLKKSEEK